MGGGVVGIVDAVHAGVGQRLRPLVGEEGVLAILIRLITGLGQLLHRVVLGDAIPQAHLNHGAHGVVGGIVHLDGAGIFQAVASQGDLIAHQGDHAGRHGPQHALLASFQIRLDADDGVVVLHGGGAGGVGVPVGFHQVHSLGRCGGSVRRLQANKLFLRISVPADDIAVIRLADVIEHLVGGLDDLIHRGLHRGFIGNLEAHLEQLAQHNLKFRQLGGVIAGIFDIFRQLLAGIIEVIQVRILFFFRRGLTHQAVHLLDLEHIADFVMELQVAAHADGAVFHIGREVRRLQLDFLNEGGEGGGELRGRVCREELIDVVFVLDGGGEGLGEGESFPTASIGGNSRYCGSLASLPCPIYISQVSDCRLIVSGENIIPVGLDLSVDLFLRVLVLSIAATGKISCPARIIGMCTASITGILSSQGSCIPIIFHIVVTGIHDIITQACTKSQRIKQRRGSIIVHVKHFTRHTGCQLSQKIRFSGAAFIYNIIAGNGFSIIGSFKL